MLRREAGISGLIVLVLALGIGGNAAIFTLLKAAFLDPLPYRDAGRLIIVMEEHGGNPSASEYLELRARSRTLEQIAYTEHRDMQLSGTKEPTRVFAARVTASFFPLLGASASLGRTFLEEENQPGRTPSVVISDSFWRAKLAADTGVVGRRLRLDSEPALVVGVLPPGFHFDYPSLRIPEPVDLYVSCPIEPSATVRPSRSAGDRHLLARMRDGVTYAQAKSELQSIGQSLEREYPFTYRNRDGKLTGFTFEMLPLREAIVGRSVGCFGCCGEASEYCC